MEYKEIPLTQGKVALVDAEDYAYLSQWKWHAMKQKNGIYYAVRNIVKDGKQTTIRMHREIMKTPKGMDTDHTNGNGLDNRKENLRICAHSQNQKNCKKYNNNSSGYKGVCWHTRDKKWAVGIQMNGEKIYLGLYVTKEKAAIAYNEAAKKLFGEYARLNIIK